MKKMCKTCGKITELLSWEDECYSCKLAKHAEEVKQAVLNGEDTDCEREIYCPWCGVTIDDPEMREAYEDGTHVIECDECGKEFTLETSVSYSYSTSRKLPEWVIEDRRRAAAIRKEMENEKEKQSRKQSH